MRYLVVLIALASPSPLLAQEWEDAPAAAAVQNRQIVLAGGLDYETGGYGTGATVERMSVPITAQASAGRLRIAAQLPWTRVTAPQNVVVPSGALGLPILVDPTGPAEIRTREGVGDLRLSAAYDLPMSGMALSVRSAVKLPTASTSKGLGTGEVDYSVGADLSIPLGKVTPFASLSYSIVGDPEGLDLRNSLSGQAGGSVQLGGQTAVHLGYGYARSTSELVSDEQRIFGGLNMGLGDGTWLGLYGSSGLSDGAPDFGAGVSLAVSLD